MDSQSNSRRRFAVAAIILAILVITLTPAGKGPTLPFSFELGIGRRWLSDASLNVCLFIPLGFALVWGSRSPVKAILTGVLLSTCVELAQMWIPGRDPSLSDIVFNTAGTIFGVLAGRRPSTWLAPDPTRSPALTIVAVAAATLVIALTTVLLTPAGPFTLSRVGNDLLLQYQSRADAVGLDQPVYWLANALPDSSTTVRASVSVRRDRTRWLVSVDGKQTTIGPTVGEGWTLLGYPDVFARRWGRMLDAAWVLLLCVPIGFWAQNRRSLAIAGVMAVVLCLLPKVAGVMTTPLLEWIGAGIGFLAGASIGWLSRRAFHDPGETSLSELRR